MSVKLDDRALTAALHMLGEAKASGLLTITGSDRFASIVLADGRLLFATSDRAPRLEETLVEKGLLDRDTLDKVWRLLRRKKVHEPLGKVLMELGLVSEETVETEIERQIMDVVGDVLAWDAGTMHLDPVDLRADDLQFGDCLQVGLPLTQLVRA